MKKVLFIGQAPPKTTIDRPFGRTKLYSWFESIEISEEYIQNYFYFGALINYFPGLNHKSHKEPSKEEILAEKPKLINFIKEVNPDIYIPVGKLAIQSVLNLENIKLEELIGKSFSINPHDCLGKEIRVIPLPHPSGASTWFYKPENKILLQKALQFLKQSL
jgi:uracil-DNA glycosylase